MGMVLLEVLLVFSLSQIWLERSSTYIVLPHVPPHGTGIHPMKAQ